MTPLVAAISKKVPDPEQGHWFDIGEFPPEREFDLEPELMMGLPFNSLFIVGRVSGGEMVLRVKAGNDGSVGVVGFAYGSRMFTVEAFSYTDDGESLRVYPAGAKDKHGTIFALSVIDALVRGLDQKQTAYVMEPKVSFTNMRKIRQGKKPSYEWRTVEVAPRAPSQSLGGTHASPRAHERRGHWRNLKKGRVWVKPCIVGNPAEGQVFHDYKVLAQSRTDNDKIKAQ